MTAYYNEIDPKAAAWLRELIKQGHIADGVVDDRSIVDVQPADLAGFTQCHFFAGIGVWSYALRRAGWADDRQVWTGSCPCQPFSAAGARGGVADERHLWPHWHHLISQCRPPVVFGEQVASKDGLGWLDLVQADLEGTGYASGAADLCAAGVGAPHIRQRLWFVGVADADHTGLEGRVGVPERAAERPSGAGGVAGGLADAHGGDASAERQQRERVERLQSEDGSVRVGPDAQAGIGRFAADSGRPGPTNGHWRSADWLLCRDGKWRPVEPGAQQMVDGSTGSLGRVRDSSIAEIEAHVEAWASLHKRDGTQGVRDLWELLSSEEAGERADGGFDSVRETPFLLAFLRQLSDQGWRFPISDECASSEASRAVVRVLRFDENPAYSSRGRGLDEQRPDEPTDPLRELSQIVAHHVEVCWGLAGWKDAGSFPLAHGAEARVARLRGYGNAIAAPAAQAFIESVMDAI